MASGLKTWLMGPSHRESLTGGTFEQEVSLFFDRVGGKAEPVVCEGFSEDSLRLVRLIPRTAKLLMFYLAYGAGLCCCLDCILWTTGSILWQQHGIFFRKGECIPESRWAAVLLADYVYQALNFGAGLIFPLLALPWRGNRKRMLAMVLFNQGGAVLFLTFHAINLVSSSCRLESASWFGMVAFVANMFGTVAIGCYPYGRRAYALVLAVLLLGYAPAFICVRVSIPMMATTSTQLWRNLFCISMTQAVLFVPRSLTPRLVRHVYQTVPGMHPCRAYALGAAGPMLSVSAVRILQAGMDGAGHKVIAAILTGVCEFGATVASPYGDVAMSMARTRNRSVPAEAFFSPYRRRLLADTYALMDVFQFAAILSFNFVFPAALIGVFDTPETFWKAWPQLVFDTAAVLAVQSFFVGLSAFWAMRVDNLPMVRARLSERRLHFAAVAVGTWCCMAGFPLYDPTVIMLTCCRLKVDLVAHGFIDKAQMIVC